MEKLMLIMNSSDMDEYSKAEFFRGAEKIIEEHRKIRGQIARDLRRIGENAFMEPQAYDTLKAKYLRAHQSKKKMAILELERKQNCR